MINVCKGGDDKLGPWIVAHPGIKKISFTGSSATGKKVQEAAAVHLKRVSLELYVVINSYHTTLIDDNYSGGNDPTIVFPDVDIPKVAKEVAQGAFFNTSQVSPHPSQAILSAINPKPHKASA